VRVVLDTNIIISALVFHSGHLVWIRQAWIDRQITPLANKACIEELLRALTYRNSNSRQQTSKACWENICPT